ncbi:MAG: PAS domain-containing protein, partial [bacterium]|nr:PAS domain-containing protein [bacterium]
MVERTLPSPSDPRPMNTVIVGGGAGCEAMLHMIRADAVGNLKLRVVGVADPDPDAAGAKYAREIGIPVVTTSDEALLKLPNLDLIIELTGSDDVRDELERVRPRHVRLIDHFSARFFWDLQHARDEVAENQARMQTKVNEERARIKQIFDSIPDEIMVLDSNMAIQQVNASFLRNNKVPPEKIQGRHCYDIEQRVRGECQIGIGTCACATALQTREPSSLVRKHFDSDGNARYAAIVAAPILDLDGEVTGLIEMTRDITHRIELEEELKATEVRLRQFMDMAPLAVSVKNREGRFVEANPAACALFGLPKSEVLGHTDREVLPLEAATALGQGDSEVLQTAKQLSFDTELILKGEQAFLTINKFPVLDAEGNASAVVGLSQDVTAQKAAEAALTRTREYLQNILDNAPMMVITTDLEGLIVSFNTGAEEILKYQAADILGHSGAKLYSDQEERTTLLRRVDQEGSIHDHEVILVAADGSETAVAITLSLLKDSQGELIGRIILGRDLSHRKALMDQIIQSERLAAVGRLAAGVAHEINNPLAIIAEIAGYLQDLVSGEIEAPPEELEREVRKGLPKILHNVNRGRSITSRLLSFSRKSEMSAQTADIGASLEEVLPLLSKRASLAQIVIHTDIPGSLPKVAIEELQLEEVLINLITNAIQAMANQERGNIWLQAKSADERVIITVRDDGPGISEEVRDRLFDPFVSTKPLGLGTGLGLSIC